MKIWKHGNIINKVNILIFRVSNYNLFIFIYFHISSIIKNVKKNSISLKMRNFHWKIQKFNNPFFIILISFSINFKQFFFVFHTFFSHLFQLFFCHCTTPLSYQSIKKKVSLYLSRFSNFALYKFVTSYARTHARTHACTHRRTFGSQYLESA